MERWAYGETRTGDGTRECAIPPPWAFACACSARMCARARVLPVRVGVRSCRTRAPVRRARA